VGDDKETKYVEERFEIVHVGGGRGPLENASGKKKPRTLREGVKRGSALTKEVINSYRRMLPSWRRRRGARSTVKIDESTTFFVLCF
jgi:hypothetical protein